VTLGRNESKPVRCYCDPYLVCGCDEPPERNAILNDVIGNGSYDSLNKTLVTVGTVDGRSTILINGTLPNGTTAPGGDEDPYDATGGTSRLLYAAGFWPALTAVVAIACAV